MSTENERTRAAMVKTFATWSRLNDEAASGAHPGVAMNAAAAGGLLLMLADGDPVRALELATKMPGLGVWADALRYLTVIVQESLADTQPPARLTVVR